MKIKTMKKLRLDELIKHIYDNNEANRVFIDDDEDFAVHTNSFGAVSFEAMQPESGRMMVASDRIFTVEVEEELKMITTLPLIVHMYLDSDGVERSENCYNQSIIECQFPTQSEELSLTMYSASGGDLTFIWNNSHGIPKSGVLEVGQR